MITTATRDKLPTDTFAGPGRTFPIRNQTDIDHAASLLHMSSDPSVTIDGVRRRAKKLGLSLTPAFEDDDDKKKSVNLSYFGSEIKALGDGKVGGYLVLFSSSDSPDVEGDFFTKDTNFAVDFDHEPSTFAWYNHALDKTIGKKLLDAKATLKKDDVGIWCDAQLDMRDQYLAAIYALAEKGALGWSSGTASHLVERERVGKTCWIKTWPLGLDASLTPTPAEPRTLAVPVKSLILTEPLEIKLLNSVLTGNLQKALAERYSDWMHADRDDKHVYLEHGWQDAHIAVPYTSKNNEVALGEPFPVRRSTFYEPEDYTIDTDSKSLTLESNIDAVLGAAERLVDRMEQVKTLRSEKSKELSETHVLRLGELKALIDKLSLRSDAPSESERQNLRLRLTLIENSN